MNKSELKEALQREHIRENLYSLNGENLDEALIVVQRSASTWAVYYSERGLQTGLMEFGTEDAACRYFLDVLLKNKKYQAM